MIGLQENCREVAAQSIKAVSLSNNKRHFHLLINVEIINRKYYAYCGFNIGEDGRIRKKVGRSSSGKYGSEQSELRYTYV